jgi:hypothetical protein
MLTIFDGLIILANGSVVYAGEVSRLHNYLTSAGHLMPPGPKESAVEFCLEILSQSTNANVMSSYWRREGLKYESNSHKFNRQAHSTLTTLESNKPSVSHIVTDVSRSRPSFFLQVYILTVRHLHYSLKSVHGFTSLILRSLLLGTIYGLLYYENMTDLLDEGQFVEVSLIPGKGQVVAISYYAYNLLGMGFSFMITTILVNGICIPAFYELNRFYTVEKVFF